MQVIPFRGRSLHRAGGPARGDWLAVEVYGGIVLGQGIGKFV